MALARTQREWAILVGEVSFFHDLYEYLIVRMILKIRIGLLFVS